jgi:RHS repeat-associated protein
VNDPTGTYAFAYDNMGRLIGTTTNYSFLSGTTFTNAYTYDAASNRTGFTAPDGSTNTYTYDMLNRLTTLANSWAGSFGFSYDALSRRTQMTRPNGVNSNYGYDSLSRLLSVLHQTGASTNDGESYTVDATGNRTSKTDQLAGVTSNYAYDALYELTQVTQAANTTESYTYDPVGNRLSSLAAATFSYNSSNQLTSNSNATYTYDANGNTTSKADSSGTATYAWDFQNRLASVTLPATGGTVTFKYDPAGRRIQKSSTAGTIIYAYDSNTITETTDGSGSILTRYAQGQGIDEPLALQQNGSTSYYHADGLGSITSLSNGSGALAQTYAFSSFGKLTSSSGSLVNPFQYTAREFDTETNLYFYRARYYDPTAGRFLNEDSIRFDAGTNFYSYVGNDATAWADPYGYQKCKKSCGLKTAPEYDAAGSVPGGTAFHWKAEFLNDATHDPKCCEVRQYISWDRGAPPNNPGFPRNLQAKQWYEDRDSNGIRYGRRTGPYSGPIPGIDEYSDNGYAGMDQPDMHHHVTLRFLLGVIDVCNGGKTVYTSKILAVNF